MLRSVSSGKEIISAIIEFTIKIAIRVTDQVIIRTGSIDGNTIGTIPTCRGILYYRKQAAICIIARKNNIRVAVIGRGETAIGKTRNKHITGIIDGNPV